MNKDKTKLNILLSIAIIYLLICFALVIFLFISMIYIVKENTPEDDKLNLITGFFSIFFILVGWCEPLSWIIVFGLFLSFFIRTTCSILIFIFDWDNAWCKKYKRLWGILTLLLLSWIGIFAFVFTAKNQIKTEYNQNNIIQENTQLIQINKPTTMQ
ncbi:MAG: hypothetical protein K2K73_01195 [Ureaplasma sp.]|nr:hypothetical protein [Ureaplasma sp.]